MSIDPSADNQPAVLPFVCCPLCLSTDTNIGASLLSSPSNAASVDFWNSVRRISRRVGESADVSSAKLVKPCVF